jgi:small-conductance mechanosensitive channel
MNLFTDTLKTAMTLLLACSCLAFSQESRQISPTAENSVSELPSPADLPNTWWDSLTENPSRLNANLKALSAELQDIPAGFDEGQNQQAQTLIRGIETNIKAYLSSREHAPETQQHAAPFQKDYSLDDFIRLAEKKKALLSKKETASLSMEQLEKSIKESDDALDREWIEYTGLKPNTQEKYLLGLEIIADRLKLAVKMENKRLLQDKLEAFQNERDRINQELDYARSHLDLKVEDQSAWEVNIQQELQQEGIAQIRLAKAYANLNPAFPDTPIGQSKKAIQDIHLNILGVKAETESADILIEQMKRDFLLLHRSPETTSNIESGDLARNWEKEITGLESKLNGYLNALKEEQENLRLVYLQEEDQTPAEQKELESLLKQRLNDSQELYIALHELEGEIATARFLLQEYQHLITSKGNFLTVALLSLWDIVHRIWETVSYWLFYSLFRIGGVPVTLFSLIEIVLIIGASYLLSSFILSGLNGLAKRKMIFAESAFYTLSRLIHYAILLLGAIIALITIGFDFTTLALIAGALSVGIGFGLQSIVKDFINGLSILFSQNIRVGDTIELKNQFIGKVKSINLLNTVIYHFDGLDLIVPNSEIIGSIMHNWTLSDPYRRLHVPFSIDYSMDKELAVEAALQAASQVPYTVKDHYSVPNPEVCIAGFGESGIEMELLVWINQRINYPTAPLYAYLWALDTAFKEKGVRMPFPQTDIHLDPIRLEGWPAKQ